eukprot:1893242-Alexandrium_andersonii.AAC.1
MAVGLASPRHRARPGPRPADWTRHGSRSSRRRCASCVIRGRRASVPRRTAWRPSHSNSSSWPWGRRRRRASCRGLASSS